MCILGHIRKITTAGDILLSQEADKGECYWSNCSLVNTSRTSDCAMVIKIVNVFPVTTLTHGLDPYIILSHDNLIININLYLINEHILWN